MNPKDGMTTYDELWNQAAAALAGGRPQIDPHLPGKAGDRRRGVALIFRLTPTVQAAMKNFLDPLAAEFPDQYFYQPAELHVTVASLISATDQWRREIADVKTYRAMLREVLSRHQPFTLEFRGVTAAANAVMFQGFPAGDTLESIRSELRRTFAAHGFAGRLDRRYRINAAHATAMRFCKPDADWRRLLAALEAGRQTYFGEMRVDMLQLIWSDWYASASSLRVIEKYPLR
jgi:2'-5' RNA ligase